MNRDRQQKIEEIFQELLDLPAADREAALAGRCGGDNELEKRVRSLITHYEEAGSGFLDGPTFADTSDDDDIPQSVGLYRIVRRIGEGGMGIVYEAKQKEPNRRIAIKVLRPGLYGKVQLSRFRREWDALGRLNHPAIASVHDAGTAEVTFTDRPGVELPYLATELVEGHSLIDHAEKAKLDRTTRLQLFATICDAVHHAHEHSVIHRDLKPGNILVDESGQPKILDFGLARICADTDHTQHTRTGDVIGTPRYMSPEQLFGNRTVDERSDIYSLGVILFELLTGESPFGKSDTSITNRILWHERGGIPEITQYDTTLRGDLDAIVRMALAENPDARYAFAAELADDVRRYLDKKPVLAPSESRLDAWRRVVRRRGRPVMGVAAVIFPVLAITLFVFSPLRVQISPVRGVGVTEGTLAVMYFENVAQPDDPDRYGEIITELLIAGLSESEHMRVVSSQRLYDLLRFVGKDGETKIDRSTATELAQRAGAHWTMQGQIVQTDPGLVVTSQIVDVETGNVTASLRTAGSRGESIFSVVDRITAETLDNLAVPDEAERVSVADMSTRSEQAYRHYLEGREYQRKQHAREAWESFLQALATDSTYAMAAYQLGIHFARNAKERSAYFAQAKRHADRASWRDRQYIQEAGPFPRQGLVRAAKVVLERYPDDTDALEDLTLNTRSDERIAYGMRLAEIDPLNETAYTCLAYAYSDRGDWERAIWACDKYEEVAPDEPNVFDTRGDVCAANGLIDEAIAAYSKALELKPEFGDGATAQALGDLYVFKGEFDNAVIQYQRLFRSSDNEIRAKGRTSQIQLLAYRGRIDEALAEIDGALTIDRMDGVRFDQAEFSRLRLAAYLLTEVGERDAARAKLTAAYGESAGSRIVDKLSSLSRIGPVDAARQLWRQFDTIEKHPVWLAQTTAAKGHYELLLGNYAAAADHLEKGSSRPEHRFALAEAYLEAARWQDVIHVLEPFTTTYRKGRLSEPIGLARLHYHLGIAYQEVGRSTDAIEQLEKFLWIWEDADPRLEGPKDARRRLAVLERGS